MLLEINDICVTLRTRLNRSTIVFIHTTCPEAFKHATPAVGMSPSRAAIGLYHLYGRGERLALRQSAYCARSAKQTKEKEHVSLCWCQILQRQQRIAGLRVDSTQYRSIRRNGVAYLSSEGRKIDKFMSTACWRYAANPCLCVPRLRLRLAPPAQTHDSVLTGSSAMPHRLWEPQSPLEMGLFRLLYGGALAGDRVGSRTALVRSVGHR